jgi:hypothetical protein
MRYAILGFAVIAVGLTIGSGAKAQFAMPEDVESRATKLGLDITGTELAKHCASSKKDGCKLYAQGFMDGLVLLVEGIRASMEYAFRDFGKPGSMKKKGMVCNEVHPIVKAAKDAEKTRDLDSFLQAFGRFLASHPNKDQPTHKIYKLDLLKYCFK